MAATGPEGLSLRVHPKAKPSRREDSVRERASVERDMEVSSRDEISHLLYTGFW